MVFSHFCSFFSSFFIRPPPLSCSLDVWQNNAFRRCGDPKIQSLTKVAVSSWAIAFSSSFIKWRVESKLAQDRMEVALLAPLSSF
jgi:hypothetical protein